MKLYILLLLVSCTKVVMTTEGKKTVSWSAKEKLLTEQFVKEEKQERVNSCMYCGLCYSFFEQKFTISCTCMGYQRARYNVQHFIRTYQIWDDPKLYTSIPRNEEDWTFITNLESCR